MHRPLTLLALLLTIGCHDGRPAADIDPIPPPREAADRRADILLVTIENLRADAVRPGPDRQRRPSALEQLADGGLKCSNARSLSPLPTAAVATIMTGRPPWQHGVRAAGQPLGRHPTLATRLADAGWSTVASVGSARVESVPNLLRGFEHHSSLAGTEVLEPSPSRVVEAARKLLEARTTDAPLFAWVHLAPTLTGPDGRPATDPAIYSQMIRRIDRALSELLAVFGNRSARSKVIVLTGTDGWELGNRGFVGRGQNLAGASVRIPMILSMSGWSGLELTQATSHLDLTPTLLMVAGLDPVDLPGLSLTSLATAAPGPDRPLVLSNPLPAALDGQQELVALVDGGWKLVEQGARSWLFELGTDPDEIHNLRTERPARWSELRARLEQLGRPGPAELQSATLADLGY